MKLALIGYGQMGKMIENCASERGDEIISTIDPYSPQAKFPQITAESLAGADAAICFTQPDSALENIQKVLQCKVPLIMGTTGWTHQIKQVRAWVQESGVAMLYSSNFSLGVNLFFRMVEEATRIIEPFDLYDVMGTEWHHRLKKDSPSGTALTLGGLLLENLSRKTSLVTERLDRQPKAEELHFASVRGGAIPGTHQVLFDSEFDSIELTHRARTRKGFAYGSLLAANWILGKKGFFTEKDLMDHLLYG